MYVHIYVNYNYIITLYTIDYIVELYRYYYFACYILYRVIYRYSFPDKLFYFNHHKNP